MPGGNKTKTLTIAEKITLIDKFKNENLSQRQFSAKHSVTLTVLNTMLKNEHDIRALMDSSTVSSSRKRKRTATLLDIDTALLKWFQFARNNHAVISGPILQAKAEQFARDLGHDDWKCNTGWLSRWKVRHNIVYKVSITTMH